MGRIDPMYQFSLDAYIDLFNLSIDKCPKSPRLEERIAKLNDYHTYAVYRSEKLFNLTWNLWTTWKFYYFKMLARSYKVETFWKLQIKNCNNVSRKNARESQKIVWFQILKTNGREIWWSEIGQINYF